MEALVQLPSELRTVVGVFQTHAESFKRKQQIAEQNRCVETKIKHRTQRNFRRQLRLLAQIDERMFRAQRLVVLVVTAGLAHQPNRRRGLRTPRQSVLKAGVTDLVPLSLLKSSVAFSLSPWERVGVRTADKLFFVSSP